MAFIIIITPKENKKVSHFFSDNTAWAYRVQSNVEEEETNRGPSNWPEIDHWWKRTRCFVVMVFKIGERVLVPLLWVFALWYLHRMHLLLFLLLPHVRWMIFLSWVPISIDLDRMASSIVASSSRLPVWDNHV